MYIKETYKGPDYEAYLLGDVIKDVDQYDVNSWFDNENFFRLYRHGMASDVPESWYRHCTCSQFRLSKPVKVIASQIIDDLFELLPHMLKDVDRKTIRSEQFGLHEMEYNERYAGNHAMLPPHKDRRPALTVFLNDNWDVIEGGYNMIMSREENRVIATTTPQFNTAMFITGETWHAAAPVWRQGYKRRTIQGFFRTSDTQEII